MDYKKRKKYLVHPGFQLKFALGFIISALAGSILSTALFNYLSMIKLEQLQWSVHVSAKSTGDILWLIFLYVNFSSLLFVFILFVITGIKMLKKTDMPVYQLIKSIELIKNGDLSTPVVLRQEDEFGYIAENINDMRELIRIRFIDSNREYKKISQAIQDIKTNIIPAEQMDKKIEETTILIKNLQNTNSYYKTKSI